MNPLLCSLALLGAQEPYPGFGSAAAALVGDLDGGGRSELVVVAPIAGKALLFRGETGKVAHVFDLGEHGSVQHVGTIPDEDGDGERDLAFYALDGYRGVASGLAPGKITWQRPDLERWIETRHPELAQLAEASPKLACEALGLIYEVRNPQGPWVILADLEGDGSAELLIDFEEQVGANSLGAEPRTRVLEGVPEADAAGRALLSLGDLDGDGVDDLIVSTTGESWSGRANEDSRGIVRAIRGDGKVLWEVRGAKKGAEGPPRNLGHGLAAAGDLNGDGKPDLVTAVHAAFRGAIVALSGADGSVLWVSPTAGWPETGRRVDAGGDWNGDGVRDALTTGYNSGCHGVAGQGVVIVSGKDGHPLARIVIDDTRHLPSHWWPR